MKKGNNVIPNQVERLVGFAYSYIESWLNGLAQAHELDFEDATYLQHETATLLAQGSLNRQVPELEIATPDPPTDPEPKPKRHLSQAARNRIAKAQRLRWAKTRAAKKSQKGPRLLKKAA